MTRQNKMSKLTNKEIIFFLENSLSFREVLQKIGYDTNGSGGYSTVKRECQLRNITIPKYHYYGDGIGSKKRLSDEDVFCENSTYSRQHIKERIIKNNLIEYKCSECGNNGNWNNKNLSLQLEHKNGINNDNRIENISFLCPNCHSQTETYASKSRKKKK
ncbi:hypothetical protein K9L67_05975 [Candidatus Woesearchaeota archaeon]|nr:hypothetical protein [Candidatus Woesearchaeota archaeon]MCF7901742.1 hypothetical protein [Candidatus Woesearchaeota archaeon]